MSYTTVTISDTLKTPGGAAVPYGIVVAWPEPAGFGNAGTVTNASGTTCLANGNFSLALNATNDAGTANTDPNLVNGTVAYHIHAFDPRSGEDIYDAEVTVPTSPTTTTLAALPVV